MAANGQLVFTDVDKVTFKGVGNTSNAVIDTTTGKIGVGVDSPDANLHVLGNCFVSTNLELGGTMTMGTVTVNARHELSAITATGNTTPHTVEFQNAETGLVTTGNVSVGKDLTVTGNVAVDTDTFFVDSVNDMVGIGTTTPGSALDVVGDAAISSNLVVANSGFSLDTNGTLKQVGDGNSKYIKLMKYFGDASNWKIATGSYTGASYQWVSIRANITRLDQDVEIIQFNYLGHNGTSHVRDPIIIGGGATSTQANEIKVYNKTSNSTYEIYLQIDSATSVEVEISHRASTIDDDYSTVVAGAIDETGLTKIYDSGTTTDLRLKGGSVGIGTTDPGTALDVLGTIRVQTGTNDATGGEFSIDTNVGHIRRKVAGNGVSLTSYDDFQFYVNATGGSAEGGTQAMIIDNSGNVGIGTSGPSSTLEVHGTGIHIQGTVLRAMSAIGTVASGAYVKLCDFSALPNTTDGICAIRIRWGGGSGGGTYYYWQGHATGIAAFNTYSDGNGTYNSAGSEPLTLNHHYHHRTVDPLTFIIDSDNANSSYGRQSIYVAPNAAIDNMSFEVIALPLRR